MLKVLVVDDEPKVRRGVSKLIEACPEKYELLGSCSGAPDVITTLGSMIPDVIVTDIRMPRQDGLEMIGYLKHRYHNLDFIILSGYDEFEYAKRALQFQVFDFLLKPLKAEELYRALDGVAEKRRINHIVRTESFADNYFFNLIRAADEQEEEKNLCALGLWEKQGSFYVAILDTGGIAGTLKQKNGILEAAVREIMPETDYLYTCFGYQLVMIWKQEYEISELEAAMEYLQKRFGGACYLGISAKTENYRQVKAAYFQALDAVKQYIYSDKETIIETDLSKENRNIAFPAEISDRIINAVKTGNQTVVGKLLDEFLDYYKERRCGILRLKRHLLLLQQKLAMLTEETGIDVCCSNSLSAFVRNIEEIRRFSEVEKVFYQNVTEMAKAAGAYAEQRMNSYYMEQILVYVQDNFAGDLSLEDVAEHVGLSVGYLGNYFKSKMDMTFTEYLTQLRMEKAKELLIHTNEKIYKIAELTGYQNSQYFVTAFKKKIGVTPAEYRKYLKK